VTETPKPIVKEKIDDHEIHVSVPQAVGLSLGLVLLGIALGLLGLFIIYRLGYADGEGKADRFLAELRMMLHRK
jgi:hypothetical protein